MEWPEGAMVSSSSGYEDQGVTLTRPQSPEPRPADPGPFPAWSDGTLDRDLRAALTHATDSLAVTYEPQVGVAHGSFEGVEAVVHWQHPERGLLGSPDFLAADRDPALVLAVAQHVLIRSLSQLAAWRTLPGCSSLYLAVNVTGVELRVPGRVAEVVELLDAIGLPPKALVLEVFEDVLLDDEAIASLQ